MRQRPILIGVITGAHGIKGEVRLRSFASDRLAIAGYGPLTTAKGETIDILRLRPQKQDFVASLKGVTDRNRAEALKGVELFIARDRLPELAQNEIYVHDLIGLTAVRPGGSPFGRIVGVENFGAGDLLDIAIDGRDDTALVPFAKQYVGEIDRDGCTVVIDLPDGYLEETERELGDRTL